MWIRRNRLFVIAIAAASFVLLGLALTPLRASAASISYDPSDLISDQIFTNKSSMSASAIQSFLEKEGGGLATYHDVANCNSNPNYMKNYYPCGKSISAADIIYDAAQAYSINPQVILATLQKEQSLITTPNPASSQLLHAMGYGCPDGGDCNANYYGFFNQVDNGAWQFRANVELMNGNNYMGYTPANYPCKNGYATNPGNKYYNPGLYPGINVSFKDDNGTVYRTLRIADAATASLYCYTPHTYNNPGGINGVPRYGSTGLYYSGSYNFVTSFQNWFGSTVYRYAASNVTVNTYSDAAHTQELSLSGNLPSNQTIYVTVSAHNTGSQTWKSTYTRVATSSPKNRTSIFNDGSWLSGNRPASLEEATVAPGQTGTFDFTLTTPPADGQYSEQFLLVADGQDQGWMAGSTFGFDITVSNPFNGKVASLAAYRNSARTAPTDDKVLTYGQTVYYTLKVKNTGANTWQSSFTKLAAKNSDALQFHDSSWPESNRPAHLQETSVSPDQTGTFNFQLTAPSATSSDTPLFQLVADGQSSGWMPGATLARNIHVVDPPLNALYPGSRIYPGQALTSSNSNFSLTLQGDGNLVLYAKRLGAVWATGTNGKNASSLVMQGDGNLVLYNNRGQAIWDTGSAHRGASTLVVQNDGNLVIYDGGGHATWASSTITLIPSLCGVGDHLSSGQRLTGGQQICSQNDLYRLVMQGDGNLVIYYYDGKAIWATGTNGASHANTVMQGDGNLVIYGSTGATWASRTAGKGSSVLEMQNDGNLVIYHAGNATWASGTDK